MCDKMAISAHRLKIVENDTFLRLQMPAKEMSLSYATRFSDNYFVRNRTLRFKSFTPGVAPDKMQSTENFK